MTSSPKKPVTFIPGDGVGPEVTAAARKVVDAAAAPIAWEEREAGSSVFKEGIASGVKPATIESIQKTRVVFKGPLETLVGHGEKSANVTLRKLFETYGNIRPVRSIPGVKTAYTGRPVDLVIVRENAEDLYAGIEYRQTPTVSQALKLISVKGCEKVIRLAFELARAEGRKKVHAATKANILKLTEGLMKQVFEKVAKEYPDIQAEHILIDNCAHQLVKNPEPFDVIVTTNMNGDIISDLASGLIGGLGFAPSANLGNEIAIFEAVHGSAPKYAGKNVINPTGAILSAVLMLRHLHEFEIAERIEKAVFATLEQGKGTRDALGDEHSLSTTAYTEAVISNLGKTPKSWKGRSYKPLQLAQTNRQFCHSRESGNLSVIGVDIFIESDSTAETLGESLGSLCEGMPFALKLIANRGAVVYPAVGGVSDCVDHWQCRFMLQPAGSELSDALLFKLLNRISEKYRWMHLEKLQQFDDALGFTKAQGED